MKKRILLLSTLICLLSCTQNDDITNEYSISTTSSPIEGGTISPESGVFEDGQVVTITATPFENYEFIKWSGSATGTKNPMTIIFNSNKNVTAIFNKIDDVSYEVPTLKTNPIKEITETSAMSGGNITNDGGKNIISKGLCWSKNQNPTSDDNFSNQGPEKGEFSFVIEGLEPNTEYFVRAYATNIQGIAYGDEISFTTKDFVDNIYEGDVLLSSQEEVDTFGANKYTQVTGDMTIRGKLSSTKITSLSELMSLKVIGGNLTIERIYITSVYGLNNITSVSGFFSFFSNLKLKEINGLNKLNYVGGRLRISSNSELILIDGINSVESVGGLLINQNPLLTGINGLNNLSKIGGSDGVMSISANPKLTHLDGLKNLNSLSGQLHILGNNELSNLNGLISLISIGGELRIENNPLLMDLCGINPLIKNGFPNGNYKYTVTNNGYNPTRENMINDECSL